MLRLSKGWKKDKGKPESLSRLKGLTLSRTLDAL